MLESFISKRVKFSRGKQKKFLLSAKKTLDITWIAFAKMLDMSTRQLSDWKNEKYLISFGSVIKICALTGEKNLGQVEIRNLHWQTKKAGRVGGLAVYDKHGIVGGNQEKRKRAWRKWWNKKGKFQKHKIINVRLPIQKPRYCKRLAEFVGIVMGDGGISRRQVTVTLHSKDDIDYIAYVVEIARDLFKVEPSVHKRQNVFAKEIVISRTELVDFCTKKLGLKIGNKVQQQIDIPAWIKNKRAFKAACVRGLIDTDGSVFTHKYKVNGKIYSYKKLQFTSLSSPLLLSVYNILKETGLKPRIARDKEVWLDSKKDMQKYFHLIGSSNKKHLKRYYK